MNQTPHYMEHMLPCILCDCDNHASHPNCCPDHRCPLCCEHYRVSHPGAPACSAQTHKAVGA